MNKKWLWLTIGVVVVGLTGCGGGGGSSQDFIVGTWEIYALSDSYGGEKVPIEETGIYCTVTILADGTWTSVSGGPGVPPQGRAGTWEKLGDDYITRVPGEDDDMLYREGSQVYEIQVVEGFGLVWLWYQKT